MPYDDPGWRFLWKDVVLHVVFAPIAILRGWRKSRRGTNTLIALRTMFLAFVGLLPIYALVISTMLSRDQWWHSTGADWFVIVVVVFGVWSLVGIQVMRSRPLPKADVDAAASYRGWCYAGAGLAMSAAMMGFVGTFFMGTLWIYFLGMAFSLIGLYLVAPRKGEIERRTVQLQAQGIDVDLGQELTKPRGERT